MKIKEQTRQLAAGCSKHWFESAGKLTRFEEIFESTSPKLSLTGIHYKHIHTIKNSSNKLEQLPETRKQA
ncbi:chlorohydrolase [Streptococcus pneumoniae]|nr:chlorohydrolase [Streptococcus pneumoniae]